MTNTPQSTRVSIIIHSDNNNTDSSLCLQAILNQEYSNIEVFFIDNSNQNESWEKAVRLQKENSQRILLFKMGGTLNLWEMCRHPHISGKYIAIVSGNTLLPADSIQKALDKLHKSPSAIAVKISDCKPTATDVIIEEQSLYNYLLPSTAAEDAALLVFDRGRVHMEKSVVRHKNPSSSATPLVSVLVFNYNYGRYLEECLQSIVNQTYKNIEICISDNASTDESWELICKFQQRNPNTSKIMSNKINIGTHRNLINCYLTKAGKYHVMMCSDDRMAPTYIETAIQQLEANPKCGYAMVHRAILNGNGNTTTEAPFYNKSCIIQGAKQAAVYMMAAVNPSMSQIVYVSNKTGDHGFTSAERLGGPWYGTRLLDFSLCCTHDIIYIDKPLLEHRLHGNNAAHKAAEDLIEIIGPYLLHRQFADIANQHRIHGVTERLPDATEKLSQLCLRYSARFLIDKKENIAEQYCSLSIALCLQTKTHPLYKLLRSYWETDSTDSKKEILATLKSEGELLYRSVSYDPPEGSTHLPI